MPLTRLPLGTAVSGNLPAANYKAGSVIQVVNDIVTTRSTSTTASYTDFLSASITPTSTSSKVLILAQVNNFGVSSNSLVNLNLLRGSTNLAATTTAGHAATNNAWGCAGGWTQSGADRLKDAYSLSFLDSPSTTSSTTYKVQYKLGSSGYTLVINGWELNSDASTSSTLTLMEIAG